MNFKFTRLYFITGYFAVTFYSVSSQRVKMVVMDHSADTYRVDLCQIPGDVHDSDVPVSVRDALVFLEHACFIAERKPKVI
jgi:hypothetical protein